jgi:hypothetical protein
MTVADYHKYDSNGRTNGLIQTTVYHHEITTSESTGSGTYTDLATVGPTITVTTGTNVIIIYSAFVHRPGGGFSAFTSVEVSGATSIPSTVNDYRSTQYSSEGNEFGHQVMQVIKFTGLTPGSNTFTMKYRTDGAVFSWERRSMTLFVV